MAHLRGDPVATQALNRYRANLVRALTALAHAHGPDAIVVGGGLLTSPDPVLEGVERSVNARLFPGYQVAIRATALGDRAALLGLASV